MPETAIVLHGFSGCGAAMAPIAEPLRAEARVFTPDLAGHGNNLPSGDHAYSIDAMAEAVASIQDRFHLVGYSMGARLALTIAVRWPQRVRSLTVIGASPGLAHEKQRRERAALDDRRARALVADPEGFIDDWMRLPMFAGLTRLGESRWTRSRAQRLANNPVGMARALRCASPGRMRYLSPERLQRVTAPVSVVVGSDDATYVRIGADLTYQLRCARLTIVPGVGHATHLEAPDAVLDAIRTVMAFASNRKAPDETKQQLR